MKTKAFYIHGMSCTDKVTEKEIDIDTHTVTDKDEDTVTVYIILFVLGPSSNSLKIHS